MGRRQNASVRPWALQTSGTSYWDRHTQNLALHLPPTWKTGDNPTNPSCNPVMKAGGTVDVYRTDTVAFSPSDRTPTPSRAHSKIFCTCRIAHHSIGTNQKGLYWNAGSGGAHLSFQYPGKVRWGDQGSKLAWGTWWNPFPKTILDLRIQQRASAITLPTFT